MRSPSETPPSDSAPEPVQVGDVVGRYRVVERLGAGGMGVVYRARDPELDRDVALKLLGRRRASSSEGQARLLREAQLTAQLSHPNVVNVFEVGVVDDRMFVSMELVEGETLAEWLRSPRSLADVLDVFVQAGRGLAAAHAAGVVHRDFKPGNVIVGRSGEGGSRAGRVRVTDFGLARLASGSGQEITDEQVSDEGTSGAAVSAPLTAAGAVVGTPQYMAPEQHVVGRTVDASADQYAFCVALYEALFGERPFAGRTIPALVMSKQRGIDRRMPGKGVPRWLYAILQRGLRVDPEERFASMDVLVAELERGPRKRRTTMIVGLTVLGVGAAAAAAYGFAPTPDRCGDLRSAMDDTWNETQRQRVRSALVASALPYAEATAERVETLLSEYSRRWIDERVAACRAGVEQAEVGRRACLDRARFELAALVDVLASADAQVTGRAVGAVAGLSPPSECASAGADDSAPADPAVAREVEALERRIPEANALRRTGRYAQGLEVAREIEAAARRTSHAPIIEQALLSVAKLAALQSELDEAERVLTEAYFSAKDRGNAATAATAAINLGSVFGMRKLPDEGREWIRHAEAEMARFDPPPSLRASLLQTLSTIHQAEGDYEASLANTREALQLVDPTTPGYADYVDNIGTILFLLGRYTEARAQHERGLELRRRDLGDAHPRIADSHSSLGACAFNLGDYAASIEHHERALAIWRAALGPDHHDLAIAHNNLGGALHAIGKPVEAIEHYRAALDLFGKHLGPDHPSVALIHNNLGTVLYSEGRCDEAMPHYRRALEIRRATEGPKHPAVAATMNNEASCLWDAGRLEEARDVFRAALEIQRESLGESHTDLGHTLSNLGAVVRQLGDPQEAVALHERALAIRQAALSEDHVDMGNSRLALGLSLLAAERAEEAIPQLEAAVRIHEAMSGRARDVADSKLGLARALWAAGGDRRRARALATEAAATYRELHREDSAREAEAWLADHR